MCSWWFLRCVPHYVGADFQDELGFIPFTGYRGLSNSLNYSREWRKGPLRNLFVSTYTNSSDHLDRRVFRRQRGVSLGFQTRTDYAFEFGWDGGCFEAFDDSVFKVSWQARASDPFHTFGVGYSWGDRAGSPITFLTPFAIWRFGPKVTVGLASSILQHQDDPPFQHILTFNYDFSPRRGLAGQIVAQKEGTNGYLAYRQSGYGGIETFLILGDPNAPKFQRQAQVKVVWPL